MRCRPKGTPTTFPASFSAEPAEDDWSVLARFKLRAVKGLMHHLRTVSVMAGEGS
jgi:hypothetical protein